MHDSPLSMNKVTVSLEEAQLERLEEIQNNGEANSRSEAVRRLFAQYDQLQEEYENSVQQYESELEELEEKISSLQSDLEREREKTKRILEQREENTELVKYVQEERTHEQRWREAGIGTRLKWRLFGMDTDDDDTSE